MTFLEKLPPITEDRFQRQVTAYAELCGWRWYHTRRSEKSPKGWPDLVCIRRPRIVFLETKAQRTRVTPDQRATIEELKACGQEAHIVRPAGWRFIEELLR